MNDETRSFHRLAENTNCLRVLSYVMTVERSHWSVWLWTSPPSAESNTALRLKKPPKGIVYHQNIKLPITFLYSSNKSRPMIRVLHVSTLTQVLRVKWCLYSCKSYNIGAKYTCLKCDKINVVNVVAIFCVCEGGGLGTTHDVHLGLIGKRVVNFLVMLVELLSQCVTAEALRAKTDWKPAFSKRVGRLPPNFHAEGAVSINHFLHW